MREGLGGGGRESASADEVKPGIVTGVVEFEEGYGDGLRRVIRRVITATGISARGCLAFPVCSVGGGGFLPLTKCISNMPRAD